jgi:hydrogenase/urease accessory protein HupE
MITSQSGQVPLNPTWFQASRGFVVLGVEHILSGIDHLLFLLCLIIPFRRIRGLIPVITAFTLGHSVTLLGSAFNLAPSGAWFPPFVETAIAASILYMALENIVGANLRRRWIIAGLFGLVHGFGFSYALKDQLQFAGSHLLVSLFSFNIGIELGQLAVLCVAVPVLGLLFRGVLAARMGVVLLSAIVAHTAWHWMIERGNALWLAPWPEVTGLGLAILARWVAALLLAVALARLVARRLERKLPRTRSASPDVVEEFQKV